MTVDTEAMQASTARINKAQMVGFSSSEVEL
jgi:hypothetical protein